MENDEQDFRVIDRRGTQKAPGDQKTSGEGFVMKEKPNEKAVTPEQIDFSTLVFSFATSALINLGIAPDPMTKQTQKNVELAKQNINILEMLQQKTKGNLTADESALLENLLMEVRLRFVEANKK